MVRIFSAFSICWFRQLPIACGLMLQAVEHIRRMRGGAQAHLMRCSDKAYYVVKFQNNPQHTLVLANEVLGPVLAGRLGLPTAPFAVIEVRQDMIRLTDDLVMQVGLSRTPCRAGLQFGSRYPGGSGGNHGLRFPAG